MIKSKWWVDQKFWLIFSPVNTFYLKMNSWKIPPPSVHIITGLFCNACNFWHHSRFLSNWISRIKNLVKSIIILRTSNLIFLAGCKRCKISRFFWAWLTAHNFWHITLLTRHLHKMSIHRKKTIHGMMHIIW